MGAQARVKAPGAALFLVPAGRVAIPLSGLRLGTHALVFRAADFQETKNMEDVGPVLPNTRVFRARFTVR